MRVEVGNNIRISQPTEELRIWAKDNLELSNPEYSKKLRMGFWLGGTPKTIALYEEDGADLIIPYGCLRYFPEDTKFVSGFPLTEDVQYEGNIPLYGYQEKAVDAVASAGFGILLAPAGSGKTQMGIALIQKFGKKALWLTHTKDLLGQSKKRAEQYLDPDPDFLGTITEGKVRIGEGITFATVQTMANLDLNRFRYEWDVVIVDECHRCAGSPTAVTMFYKVLNNLSARHKVGLTATAHRADGLFKATTALLGDVVYEVSDKEVADKVMPVEVIPIETKTKLSYECFGTDGMLQYASMITYLASEPFRQQLIVDKLVEEPWAFHLILSDRLSQLEELIELMPAVYKPLCVMVSGKMTSKTGKAKRVQAIEDMRAGKKNYLFATYALAKEGLDIPRLDRLYLATPQKDYAIVTQAVGRIARKHPEKTDAIVYDFVDDSKPTASMYRQRLRHYRKLNAEICHED